MKINPWSWIFKHIGNMMLGDFRNEMLAFKSEQERKNVNDMRWEIINFANSCRRHEQHTKDAWNHLLTQLCEYEYYIQEKKITNGVIDAESKYLKNLYENINKKNDFI